MADLAQEIKSDRRYSERTQISLSPTLRRIIDAKRRLYGESLSEYIRKAVSLRVLSEEEKREARIQAVERFVGAGKKEEHPEWSTSEKVTEWQRKIRRESEKSLEDVLKLWKKLRG